MGCADVGGTRVVAKRQNYNSCSQFSASSARAKGSGHFVETDNATRHRAAVTSGKPLGFAKDCGVAILAPFFFSTKKTKGCRYNIPIAPDGQTAENDSLRTDRSEI